MVSDLNKNFGGSTDLAKKKKARIGGFAYSYSPPPGDDQLFEYDDDSNGFVVEEDGCHSSVICRARNWVSS